MNEQYNVRLIQTRWIRLCIGVAILGATVGVLLLAATPFIRAIRWG